MNKSETEQREYVSNSARIMIPHISVERLAQIYINNDPTTFEFTLKKIRKKINISNNKDRLAFSTYLILHEIGHWYHFDEMGRKPYIYAHEDSELRKEVFNKQKELELEMSIKKSTGKLTQQDEMKMKNWVIEYNNIPMEKRANNYADDNFKEIWLKLNSVN